MVPAQPGREGPYTTRDVLQPEAEALEAALIAEYHRDLVGEFWRREISLRTLRVARDHLPPDSAWHRALNGGHQWTNNEALLWLIVHVLERLDARLVWHRGKRPKWPVFKSFPWARDNQKIGDREGFTDEQVLAYLRSKAPPGSAMLKRKGDPVG